MERKSFLVLLLVVMGCAGSLSALAANEVLDAKIDQNSYLVGENVSASGTLYSDAGPIEDAVVSFSLDGDSGTANTDADGNFVVSTQAPGVSGTYTLTLSYGSVSVNSTFTVSYANNIRLAIISSASDSYKVIDFSSTQTAGISSSGTVTGSLAYGNFSLNSTTYYAILQENDDYDTMFISQFADFSSIRYQYLAEGSQLKLNSVDYTVFYIDPTGQKAVFLRTVEPVFYGTGSEWASLFILPLNAQSSPVLNMTTFAIEHLNAQGTYENITNNITSPYSFTLRQGIGYKVQSIFISRTGGIHNLIVAGMSHISYFVKKFSFKVGAETADGSSVSTASSGQNVVLKASIVDLDTGASTSNATITARVKHPDGSDYQYTLVPNSQNMFAYNITLPVGLIGEYTVTYEATYGNSVIRKDYKFSVKSNDIFMKAFSPGKGTGDGFPPSTQGYILIGMRDYGTQDLLNLTAYTNNCNSSRIYLKEMLDEGKAAQQLDFSVYNLSALWTQIPNAPQWIRTEMSATFGSGGCAIRFTTPARSGTYKIAVETNISGTTYKTVDYLDVTSLFVYGMPSHCTTGSWSDSVSPGSRICIKVNVYDASTGTQIAASNITSLDVVEVYSEGSGVITDDIGNITLNTFSSGEKGIAFRTSDSTLGNHFVKFRVRANTSNGQQSGLGNSWFRTELWSVWAYPTCSQGSGGGSSSPNMFCSFGSNSTVRLKVEAYTAGYSGGQDGITASVATIKNIDTGETVSLSAQDGSSCTTVDDNSSSSQNSSTSQGGRVLPAHCTVSLAAPDAGWGSGNYEVKITASDATDNNMSFYSWFKVESFRFWLWNRNWEITTSQDAAFDVTIQDFAGGNIDADVVVSKLYYMGDGGKFGQPREILVNATEQPIEGHGTYTLSSASLAGLKSGFYDIVFTATGGQGTQTARTGFNIRSFVVITNPLGQNWDRSYELGGNLTLNVTAFGSVNWSTWPPTGSSRAIANITVKRINKDGMYDSPYRADGRDQIGATNDCDGVSNTCVVTIPLAGFAQSHYMVEMEVIDTAGNTAMANYDFRTSLYTITVPEIQDFRVIPSSNRLTDTMEVTLGTGVSCGTSTDSVFEPANVTSCLFDADQRLPTIYDTNGENEQHNRRTVFLLDKTNNSAPKLYINRYNDSWTHGYQEHYNFTLPTTVGPISVGSLFTDDNGYQWNLTAIDVGLGRLTLKSQEGVIRTFTRPGGQDGETQVEYRYQYVVNKSFSKSGVFLFAGNGQGEDKFWDDQWSKIDLDADGVYNCNENGNHTWTCEEYYLLLADRETTGVYDTLLVSPARNMTLGVNSFDGFSGGGAGDIRLNASADPIYILNIIYSESNGVGSYRLVTTTNKAGWPGRQLGVFQIGSDNIRIPVMIASPSTMEGIANKQVVIRTLRTFGGMNFVESGITPAVANTSSNGVALLDVNLSILASGEYMVVMEVNESGTYITTSTDWDNPRLELRAFSISNLFGLRTTITNFTEWSEAKNNLFKLSSAEASLGDKRLRIQCGSYNNDIGADDLCHVDDWRYRVLWVNLSDETLINDPTPNDWRLTNGDLAAATDRWSLGEHVTVPDDFTQGTLTYNFTNITVRVKQFILVQGDTVDQAPAGSDCTLRMRLDDTHQGAGEIVWTVSENCPWSGQDRALENNWSHNINERRFLWDLFNISSISDAQHRATINYFESRITLASPVQGLDADLEDGNDGRIRVVSDALGTGIDLYIYNSNQTKTVNDLGGFSGSYDKVAVVNGSEVLNSYRFGTPIAELGNGNALVYATPWEQYVYLSNLSISGRVPYPLPWSCDQKTFYVGTFTEVELGYKMYDCYEAQQMPLSARTNYLVLFDSVCDGVSQVTNAKFDDDPVLDDQWVNGGGFNGPYDYDHAEEGEINPCDNGQPGNASERWIDIGREGWPLSITSFNSTQVDLFKTKNGGISPQDNITEMNLWIQAKNFDGSTIDGTIEVDKATGTTWTCGMMNEVPVTVLSTGGQVTDGMGYINLDLSNMSSSQPTIRFKVVDGSDPGRYEYVTKSFWYGPAQNNMGGGSDGPAIMEDDGGDHGEPQDGCGDMFKKYGSGGGGPGEGPSDLSPEEELEAQRCSSAGNMTACQGSVCAWVLQDTFKTGEPPMDNCAPCFVFDDMQASCEDQNASCTWIAAGAGGIAGSGVCDPRVA